jgi:TatD DNase family protein
VGHHCSRASRNRRSSAVPWFDSHCHLQLCSDGSIDDILTRARVAGVINMLVVGIDGGSSDAALEIAERHNLVAAVGIHPNSANEFEGSKDHIHRLLGNDRVVAVGETGLDFYRDSCPADTQRRSFRAHIDMAKTADKALVIHTRDSVDEALNELEASGPPKRFVFHCWSGDAQQLKRALALGGFVSFAGNVSFKNADELRELAGSVPGDRLLVETDSPFLSPVPWRGRPNEPGRVVQVGEAVARARGKDAEEVAASTYENACHLLALNR